MRRSVIASLLIDVLVAIEPRHKLSCIDMMVITSWLIDFSAGRMEGGSKIWRISSELREALARKRIRLHRKTPVGVAVH